MKLFSFLNSVPHSSQPHRDEWAKRRYLIAAAVLCLTAAALAAYQTIAPPPTSQTLAAMLPQGALLTIESPDFATLLHDWNASPQQRSWLASDNYSVFTNSRVFNRLTDARTLFETTAQTQAAFDGDFLTQVAGKQSIFAWYDIGNLQFLYITRISAAQTANIALLKDRAAWSTRQSAGTTFYLRKAPTSGPISEPTVAFAQVPDPAGDLLILATREDLIANALALIHKSSDVPALTQEPWYAEANAISLRNQPAALHMVLNLDRLVPTPWFRSYWVQQNITEMKQYRAAVSNLYRESNQFREERALFYKNPADTTDEAYLSTLTATIPQDGVYRAIATHAPQVAVVALEEKLLGRIQLDSLPDNAAPDPTLDAPQSGSTSDLETRIDAPAPVSEAVSNQALANTLQAAGLDAVLTWSSAQSPPTAAGLWVPIHSAVVLESATPWNPQALQSALQQSLRGSLTTGTLGIEFRADTAATQTIYTLTGPKPLYFSTLTTASPSTSPTPVNLCFLTDDRALLLTLLQQANTLRSTESRTRPATTSLLAGFDHTSQRAPYARLTTLIDGTNNRPNTPATPAYFSANLRSLSDSFAALASQQLTQRRDGSILRQSLTYQWQTK